MIDVAAAIIKDQGKVLIARRAPGEKMAGFWEFPGGKVEGAETPEQCLKRELHEEFGIEAFIGEFFDESIYDYSSGVVRLLAYHASVIDGDMTLNVHDRYVWARPEDLPEYDLLPADIPIARKLAAVGAENMERE